MFRFISVALTFIGGLYFFLEFILVDKISYGDGEVFQFGRYYEEITIGFSLISNMAVGLGVINILMVHGRTLLSWRKGALSSLSLLFFFVVTLFFQIRVLIDNESLAMSWRSYDAIATYLKQIDGEPSLEQAYKINQNINLLIEDDKFLPEYVTQEELQASFKEFATSSINKEVIGKLILALSDFKVVSKAKTDAILAESSNSQYESLILKGMFDPLSTSMFSLLAFYIGYAAYRTFRVQSKEAMVMMLAALLIILGQIPQGPIYISEDLPELRFWLMEYLSTPAFRAIYFSSAIAGLGLAVRMWFSIEKNPY